MGPQRSRTLSVALAVALLVPVIIVLMTGTAPTASATPGGAENYTVTASDGYIWSTGNDTYANIRGGTGFATVSADSAQNILEVGQYYEFDVPPYYEIYRSFLYFNTADIPDSATITGATLGLRKFYCDTTPTFAIVVQNGQPTYPHDPLVAGDWDSSYYSDNGGSENSSGIPTSTWSTITLNATGLGWINKTGTTKFAIRSSREINQTEPTGSEAAIFYSYEKGAGWQPWLYITWNVPPNKPTSLLCEGLASPVTHVTDLTPEFSAIGTDNDGDKESAYALQVDDD